MNVKGQLTEFVATTFDEDDQEVGAVGAAGGAAVGTGRLAVGGELQAVQPLNGLTRKSDRANTDKE